MSTFREQIQEIVNSDIAKAKKKQQLKELGLTSSDISQLLFDHEAAKKMAAKDAELQASNEPTPQPAKSQAVSQSAPQLAEPATNEPAPLPAEECGSFFDHYDKPNKENTLYLTIKQVYFDAIVAGTKKEEYREIKDTTYKKYLQCDDRGYPLFDPDMIAVDDPDLGDPMVWNGGNYPYAPRLYQYLNLAVGYAKERDTALMKVVDFSFAPAQDKDGRDARFATSGDRLVRDDNGTLCLWVIAYHLGEVVELHRKGC